MSYLKYLILFVPLLFIGCSENRMPDESTDRVSMISDNVYVSAYSSAWSEPAARNGSRKQAMTFCNNQGKEFVLRSMNSGDSLFSAAQAETLFSCVDFNDSSSTANAIREKQRNYEKGQRIKAQWISSYNESINEKKRIKEQERLRKREVEALENIQYNLRQLNDKGYNCRIVGQNIRCD